MNARDKQKIEWAAVAVEMLKANRTVAEEQIACAIYGPPNPRGSHNVSNSQYMRWFRVRRLMMQFGFILLQRWVELPADDTRRKYWDFAGALRCGPPKMP